MNKILQHHYGQGAKSTQPPNQTVSSLEAIHHTTNNNNNNNANHVVNSNNTQVQNEAEIQEEENMQKWIDQYNSPKDSIRFTSERFPRTFQLCKDLTIPLGAILQPYYSNFVIFFRGGGALVFIFFNFLCEIFIER